MKKKHELAHCDWNKFNNITYSTNDSLYLSLIQVVFDIYENVFIHCCIVELSKVMEIKKKYSLANSEI